MSVANKLTSNRPYLIRAMYEWISDNGLTPYLLVDARPPGVHVPPGAVKDGQVVLNVAIRAVSDLELGNHQISFLARFSGVSHQVSVPVSAVLAIYAQENGQGMMFPAESAENTTVSPPDQPEPPKNGPKLRIVK
jgi:stringent starvation protein B